MACKRSSDMNIAVIQLANFGDVVLSTSLLEAIREQRPEWKIHFITTKACVGAVSNNPNIHELVTLDIPKSEAIGKFDEVFEGAKACGKYDKVITPWAGYLDRKHWRPNGASSRVCNFMYSVVRCIQDNGMTWNGRLVNYLYPTSDDERGTAKIIEAFKSAPGKNVLLEAETLSKQSQLDSSWLPEVFFAIRKRLGKATFWFSIGKDPDYLTELKNEFDVRTLSDFSITSVGMSVDHCDVFLSVSSGTANACHHQHRQNNPMWFEAVNDRAWATTPYGTINKHVYLGKTVGGYVDLINRTL